MTKKKNKKSKDEITWTDEEEQRFQFLVAHLRLDRNRLNENQDGFSKEFEERRVLGKKRLRYLTVNPPENPKKINA